MSLLIKNAKIISNGKKSEEISDIYIEDGKIVEIAEKIEKTYDDMIDAKGKYVMPGFIDVGCEIFENGYDSKENVKRLTSAGSKGGFTSISTSSSSNPVVDNKAVVEYINSKCKLENIINIYPLGSITKGGDGKEISEIGGMVLTDVVGISDGGRAIKDTNLLRDIFLYSKMFDITVMTTILESDLVQNGIVNYGFMATKLGLKGIPKEAEEIEASRNLILAKYTGAKVHISYVTTKGTVELIRLAKKDGVKVTCSTAPHYFTLTDRAIENYNTFAKVMPPLREDEDILAVKEGLKDGTIDMIASGHTPALYEKKITEFERADFGISSLDITFNIVNTVLVREGVLKLEDLSVLMSKNPAKILGLNKGEIKKGFDADIIIIDENTEKIVKSSEFLSRAKYSPYENMLTYGEVLATVVGGNILYKK